MRPCVWVPPRNWGPVAPPRCSHPVLLREGSHQLRKGLLKGGRASLQGFGATNPQRLQQACWGGGRLTPQTSVGAPRGCSIPEDLTPRVQGPWACLTLGSDPHQAPRPRSVVLTPQRRVPTPHSLPALFLRVGGQGRTPVSDPRTQDLTLPSKRPALVEVFQQKGHLTWAPKAV